MKRTLHMSHQSASAIVRIWDDGEAVISNLFAHERRQGHATELMKKIMNLADEENLMLVVKVQAYGRSLDSPSNVDLVAFYSKLGFELDRTSTVIFMVRKPSQELHGL